MSTVWLIWMCCSEQKDKYIVHTSIVKGEGEMKNIFIIIL